LLGLQHLLSCHGKKMFAYKWNEGFKIQNQAWLMECYPPGTNYTRHT